MVEDEIKETRRRKKRDKRLKQHYTITIGNKQVKIINYLFKRKTNAFGEIELIILKSNLPFPSIDWGVVTIHINNENEEVNIVGKYDHAVLQAGIYDLAFSITQKLIIAHQAPNEPAAGHAEHPSTTPGT